MTVIVVTDAAGQHYQIDAADESRFGRWVVDVACRDADKRETAYFRSFRTHTDTCSAPMVETRMSSMA